MWNFLKGFLGYPRQAVVTEVAPYKVEAPVVEVAAPVVADVPAAAMKAKKPRAKKPKATPAK